MRIVSYKGSPIPKKCVQILKSLDFLLISSWNSLRFHKILVWSLYIYILINNQIWVHPYTWTIVDVSTVLCHIIYYSYFLGQLLISCVEAKFYKVIPVPNTRFLNLDFKISGRMYKIWNHLVVARSYRRVCINLCGCMRKTSYSYIQMSFNNSLIGGGRVGG